MHDSHIEPQLHISDVKYVFQLYVAGDSPNSTQALGAFTKLCEEYFPDQFQLDVIDVLQDYQQAIDNHILVTPTLLRIRPLPQIRVAGNLSDEDHVLSLVRG